MPILAPEVSRVRGLLGALGTEGPVRLAPQDTCSHVSLELSRRQLDLPRPSRGKSRSRERGALGWLLSGDSWDQQERGGPGRSLGAFYYL